MASVGRQDGFTLLEIMIAVLITSMLSIGVWQSINTLLASRDGIERASGQFRDLQRTMLLLERDLFQAVKRPVKDGFGDALPAMTSRRQESAIELTRKGWRNPLGVRRSNLQRVAWEYNELEQRVLRRFWEVLDRAQNSQSREQQLLERVTAMEVRFLAANDEWVGNWPPAQRDSQRRARPRSRQSSLVRAPLPRAVEVTFEHKRFGTLRRLIDLGQDPATLGGPAGQGGGNASQGTQGAPEAGQ